MNKTILAIAVALITTSSATAVVAQNSVQPFFVNGMWTDTNRAERHTELITRLMQSRYPNYPQVLLLENTHQGKSQDLFEAVSQYIHGRDIAEAVSEVVYREPHKYTQLIDYIQHHRTHQMDETIVQHTLVSIGGNTGTQTGAGTYLVFEDLSSHELTLIEQFIQAIKERIKPLVPDLGEGGEYVQNVNRIERTLSGVLDNGDGVSIVAHSQGNFFANDALKQAQSLGKNTRAAKMLSVGTPDSEVFQDGQYVNLSQDYIMGFLSGLLPNVTNDNMSMGAHGWADHYLKSGSQSEEMILSALKNDYTTLQTEVSDVPLGVEYENIYMKQPFLSSTQVKPGGQIKAGVDVCYTGNRTNSLVPNPNVAYYLSSKAGLVGNYRRLSDDSASVGIDRPCDGEADWVTIPTGTPAGQYYLVYQADWKNEVPESPDDNDNITYLPFIVESPDTVTDNITVDRASVEQRGDREFYATVYQNYSGTTLKSALPGYPRVGYYISADPYLSDSDLLLDSDSSSIGSDDTSDRERESLRVPSYFSSGNYYILFVGDYQGIISETNEHDNITAVSVRIN
ncbi:hypothetical protein MK079_02550 [Candidatus Gracilibacteria bacterium]|nr:hypothetical protein [Candidatus Gracilibacteria bacterium]